MKQHMRHFIGLFGVVAASTVMSASTGFAQTVAEVEKAKEQIWAKEKAIYAGRLVPGDDFYYRNTAPGYLAWVYGTLRPFRRDFLTPKLGGVPSKEKITNELSDFSLQGDTAIIYYVNHRTALADGTPVDQYLDNIHVWIRDGADWKVLASMSRLEDPKDKTPAMQK